MPEEEPRRKTLLPRHPEAEQRERFEQQLLRLNVKLPLMGAGDPLPLPCLKPPDGEEEVHPEVAAAVSFPPLVKLRMSGRALVLLDQGRLQEAAEWWEGLARREPGRSEGWLGVAACLVLAGEVEQARKFLLRAAQVDPAFPVARVLAGMCAAEPQRVYRLIRWWERRGDRREAAAAAEALLKSGACPPGLYARLDRTYKRLRDFLEQEALRDRPELFRLARWKRRRRLLKPYLRWGLPMVLLALAAWTALSGHRLVAAEYHYWLGRRAFFHAYSRSLELARLEAGPGEVPDPDYGPARRHLEEAVAANPRHLEAQVLLLTLHQQVVEHEGQRRRLGLPPRNLGEARREEERIEGELRRLDPLGRRRESARARLRERLQELESRR